nr:Non-structural protein NSP1 like [uncultured Mediterranean phage uvMED]
MSNNGKPTALQTEGELATSAFESFLAPEEDTQEEAVIEEAKEVIEPEIDELEEQDDLGTEELVDEEDLEYDDDEDGEEETEVEEVEEQPVYRVTVDGSEIEVTQDELINGYSRQQDYTRKTQELANQRKTIEEQSKELAQRDAIYAQLLPKLEAELQASMVDEPDWKTLVDEDPVAYVREQQIWNEKKEKLEAAKAERQRLEKEAYEKQQQQLVQFVQEGQQKLLEIIPEWKNAEVAQKEKLAIRDYGINVLGYAPQEMDAIYDYRALLGLRNAWLNSKTVEATKKKPTQKAPARVARPGTTTRKKSVAPAKRAKQVLAKSGKVQDAAKVFEQFLK